MGYGRTVGWSVLVVGLFVPLLPSTQAQVGTPTIDFHVVIAFDQVEVPDEGVVELPVDLTMAIRNMTCVRKGEAFVGLSPGTKLKIPSWAKAEFVPAVATFPVDIGVHQGTPVKSKTEHKFRITWDAVTTPPNATFKYEPEPVDPHGLRPIDPVPLPDQAPGTMCWTLFPGWRYFGDTLVAYANNPPPPPTPPTKATGPPATGPGSPGDATATPSAVASPAQGTGSPAADGGLPGPGVFGLGIGLAAALAFAFRRRQ